MDMFSWDEELCRNCEAGDGVREITIYDKWGEKGEYGFCGDGCEGQWMRENSMTYSYEEEE